MNTNKFTSVLLLSLSLLFFSCGGEEYAEESTNDTVKEKSDNVELDESLNKERIYETESQELIDLIPGKLAFDFPREMKVGKRYDVTFSITRSLDNEVLFKGLDSSKFEIRDIEVSSGMRVLLYDPEPEGSKNFDISTKDEVLFVSSDRNTKWLWHVKPLKKGTHTIIIKVFATVYDKRGTEREISQEVFKEKIQVEATPSFTFTKFFKEHWQWLFGTLLIPIFVYFYRKREKKE